MCVSTYRVKISILDYRYYSTLSVQHAQRYIVYNNRRSRKTIDTKNIRNLGVANKTKT